MKFQVKRDYRQLRSEAYPSIEDQLDAIFKGGEALKEMKAKVAAVKTEFPKHG